MRCEFLAVIVQKREGTSAPGFERNDLKLKSVVGRLYPTRVNALAPLKWRLRNSRTAGSQAKALCLVFHWRDPMYHGRDVAGHRSQLNALAVHRETMAE